MGIDSPIPGPEAPKRYGYSFFDANTEGFFSPEDQEDAEQAVNLYQRISSIPIRARIQIHTLLKRFIDHLAPEEDSAIRESNIFHLFFGSSRTEENWRKNRLHTTDGKFEQFIGEQVEPLVAKLESKIQNS